ncbi:hypothetical protein [Halobacillus sp. A5]|uniref:hypothetical protein n=1 Tax=Halobacillus sp. A5 TaxID=2880263 RepID=UPI0020A6B264|nr:hypothetical protein [Halobacillus sp. A5]MCP3026498.1 hypothetical protein [Halobacillus sp. A5]
MMRVILPRRRICIKPGMILGVIVGIGVLFLTVQAAVQAFHKKKGAGYAAAFLIPFTIGVVFQSQLVMWVSPLTVIILAMYQVSIRNESSYHR